MSTPAKISDFNEAGRWVVKSAPKERYARHAL